MSSVYGRIQVGDVDLTSTKEDAIIVLVDSNFESGVHADAVLRAAGPELKYACAELAECGVGKAQITPGFNLPAKHVIFTQVPAWNDGEHGEGKVLAQCYYSCMTIAVANSCRSVAFPAVSHGAKRFPHKLAIAIAVSEVVSFLEAHPGFHVTFVCSGELHLDLAKSYEEELENQKKARVVIDTVTGDQSTLSVFEELHAMVGDITTLQQDAIVNAANNTLMGGGGVDGAIHRAAGSSLLAECSKLGGCATGCAKLTRGYRLPARFVIHTVGPVWRGGRQEEEEKLRSCYQTSLGLAEENQCKTVAIPAISCGVYGFPFPMAAQIALDTVVKFKLMRGSGIRVTFCCFRRADYAIYEEEIASARARFGALERRTE